MKKLSLTIVCALTVTGTALAQGTLSWTSFAVNFVAETNTSASPLFGGSGTGGVSGFTPGGSTTLYYYELLYNMQFTGSQIAEPTAASLFGGGASGWLDTGLTATNGIAPNGRIQPANNGSVMAPTPASWNNGTTNNIVLIGWSANLGTSWLSVSNILAAYQNGDVAPLFAQVAGGIAFFGESVTGYLNPAPAGNPGPSVFGPTAGPNGLPINNGLASRMQLYVIAPEPGTIALIGLGGLSMLLFHRRK